MRVFLIILLLPIWGRGQLTSHSRGAGMGDLGIATSHGQQSLGYNIGQTVFTQYLHQTSVSYLPYLRALFQDTKFIRADYLTTSGESTTLGVALQYLDLGNLTTRDNNGASLAIYRNTLYQLGGSIGVRLTENSGIGTTLRVIGARAFDGGGASHRYGVSADLQYYQSIGSFSIGAVLNQLGNDLWQATEVGLGVGYRDHDALRGHTWTVGLDLRKPLRGPLRALRYTLGGEFGFAESFFVRTGISLESKDFGHRQYVAVGAGYKGYVDDQSWGIDLHYQVPVGSQVVMAPMQQAYGLTLFLNIGRF